MSRILAIDYGLKRIGIAITDHAHILATPLTTIENKDLISFLQSYFQAETVDTIVIGIPKDISSDSDIVKAINTLQEDLKSIFKDKNIVTVDERYTSKIATFLLNNYSTKRKQRRKKKNIDKISAAVILQSYLNARKKLE